MGLEPDHDACICHDLMIPAMFVWTSCSSWSCWLLVFVCSGKRKRNVLCPCVGRCLAAVPLQSVGLALLAVAFLVGVCVVVGCVAARLVAALQVFWGPSCVLLLLRPVFVDLGGWSNIWVPLSTCDVMSCLVCWGVHQNPARVSWAGCVCVCAWIISTCKTCMLTSRGMRHDCGTALNEATTIMGYWIWSIQRTCQISTFRDEHAHGDLVETGCCLVPSFSVELLVSAYLQESLAHDMAPHVLKQFCQVCVPFLCLLFTLMTLHLLLSEWACFLFSGVRFLVSWQWQTKTWKCMQSMMRRIAGVVGRAAHRCCFPWVWSRFATNCNDSAQQARSRHPWNFHRSTSVLFDASVAILHCTLRFAWPLSSMPSTRIVHAFWWLQIELCLRSICQDCSVAWATRRHKQACLAYSVQIVWHSPSGQSGYFSVYLCLSESNYVQMANTLFTPALQRYTSCIILQWPCQECQVMPSFWTWSASRKWLDLSSKLTTHKHKQRQGTFQPSVGLFGFRPGKRSGHRIVTARVPSACWEGVDVMWHDVALSSNAACLVNSWHNS